MTKDEIIELLKEQLQLANEQLQQANTTVSSLTLQVNELIECWNKLAAVDKVILFVELICVLRTPIQVVCIRKVIRFSARLHIS